MIAPLSSTPLSIIRESNLLIKQEVELAYLIRHRGSSKPSKEQWQIFYPLWKDSRNMFDNDSELEEEWKWK